MEGFVPVSLADSARSDSKEMKYCCKCSHPSPELLFTSCGCAMHVMCVSAFSLCKRNGAGDLSDDINCPVCGAGAPNGIYLYPIDVRSLERNAISKSSPSLSSSFDVGSEQKQSDNSNDQSTVLEEFYASIAPLFSLNWSLQCPSRESSSSSTCSSTSSLSSSSSITKNRHQHSMSSSFTDDEICFRNGRWSTEEVQLVDAAMKSFDEGELPISRGTTLNDFLRSLLLCKSTRLRKKIKNANFCTRNYSPKVTNANTVPFSPSTSDFALKFANLHQKFLDSIEDSNIDNRAGISTTFQCDRNLLRFSMSRAWGILFYKFCMDVGYTNLKAHDWWEGLEDVEIKALEARNKRKQIARRKKADSIPKTGIGAPGVSLSMDVVVEGDGAQYMYNSTIQEVPRDFPSPMSCSVITEESQNNKSRHETHILPNPMTPTSNIAGTGSQETMLNNKRTNGSIVQKHGQKQHIEHMSPIQDTWSAQCDNDHQALSSKRTKINQYDDSKDQGNIPTVTDLCDKLADWSPFIEKVSNYLTDEHLPFQYFDIWVTDTNTNASQETKTNDASDEIISKENASAIALRHVGHATNPALEDIFTLYHMSEFGRYSSNFMFTPGIGLPGRVYGNRAPLWDECIQNANLNDFPRVKGARSHGVNKALGIPLSGRTEGEIIILALYGNDVITKDPGMLQKVCVEFMLYKPKVSWELVLDVGNDAYVETQTSVIESAQCAGDINMVEKDDTETKIVDLLGRYAPLEHDPHSSPNVINILHSFMSLRLLLLQPQSSRTDDEINAVNTLKCSYGHYLKSSKKENEIATLLANDWAILGSDISQKPRNTTKHPIALNINEVNYASF